MLLALLGSRPELEHEAREAADALLASLSMADVADRVFGAVHALDLDDMRAGDSANGYIEPTEAACESLAMALEPFCLTSTCRPPV